MRSLIINTWEHNLLLIKLGKFFLEIKYWFFANFPIYVLRKTVK